MLNEKQLKSISKFLSFILRHHPEQIGITLDKDGWVDIDTLLTQVNHPERGFTGNPLTYEVLLEVVENNDKKQVYRIRRRQTHPRGARSFDGTSSGRIQSGDASSDFVSRYG